MNFDRNGFHLSSHPLHQVTLFTALFCIAVLSPVRIVASPVKLKSNSAAVQYKLRAIDAHQQQLEHRQQSHASQLMGKSQTSPPPEVGIRINREAKTASTLFFYDNMESGTNGWTTEVYSGADIWHQTTLNSSSPTHSWWAGIENQGNYNTGARVNTAVKSPPINLAGASGSVKLIFAENYFTERGWDYCMVDVSTNGGASWTNLRGGYGVAPTGDSDGWIITSIDLSAYAGQTITLRFYFDTGDANFNDFAGWFFDDVVIFDEGGIVMGKKFFDVNGNSVKDVGDRGLHDWFITASGPVTLTTRTNYRGHYEIPLPQGSYTLTEALQSPWSQTYPPGNQWSVTISTPDTVIDSLWFGNYTQASFINGIKFDDINKNGVYDGGDTLLPNWRIVVTDTLGTVVDHDYTDSLGVYQLHILQPGRYIVREATKRGWVQSFPSSETYTVDIPNLTTNLTGYDFGNYQSDSVNSILGQKFNDHNRNGVKDNDEIGVAGFSIKLTGPKNRTVQTDSSGFFEFLNLTPGTYHVKEIQQAGWWKSFPDSFYIITLNGGDFADSVDFGNYQILPGSIGGMKFHDVNNNGLKDGGESGLSGWHISLSGTNYVNASITQTTITDGSGNYSFPGLWPGNYTISEVWKNGWIQTYPANLGVHSISLGLEQNLTGVDFGNYDSLFIGSFRTFLPESLALAVNKSGNHKPVPLKPDKDEFWITVYNPAPDSAHTLKINFSINVDTGSLSLSKPGTVQIPDPTKPNKLSIAFDSYVQGGDSVTFHGIIKKTKPERVNSYRWVYNDSTGRAKTYYTAQNYHRLPMPNPINMVQLVGAGSRVGLGGPHSVVHPSYTYVMKSLVERLDRMHLRTSVARCLNFYAGTSTPIRRQINYLSPSRGNNKLFAEALALKLNIAGSDNMILPPGLGNLIFDEGTGSANPMNGLTLREITARVDSFMSSYKDTGTIHQCEMPPSWSGFSPETLYTKIRMVDSVFCGPLDTISFGSGLKFTSVLPLSAVSFLRFDSHAAPVIVNNRLSSPILVPDQFALHQNYPNPFNPTTTVPFTLAQRSLVTVKIYNILGQEVATLLNRELMDEGLTEVQFDAGNLPSGVYFYHLKAEGIPDEEGTPGQTFTSVKKMMLMK